MIDEVRGAIEGYFNHLSARSYVRILDTPRIWGMPFDETIMPQAFASQLEFARAVEEIIQKARYRCDLASLNSPDQDWTRVVLGAMDTALTENMGREQPTQFRFLFGQTPLYPFTEPPNYTDFKGAMIRLVRARSQFWEKMPEVWVGRFYRLEAGMLSALANKTFIFAESAIATDDTKMTWNHTKIIAVDGAEALVGGHNLNMDLFRSYPPVHDVSVVVHGEAAYGSQLFLNRMWLCETDLLTKEYLDLTSLTWKNGDDDGAVDRKPVDPLYGKTATQYMWDCQSKLLALHERRSRSATRGQSTVASGGDPTEIRAEDLRTLVELTAEVFPYRVKHHQYDRIEDYKLATRVLSVGKYWTGPIREQHYQRASEVMKEYLIKNAKRIVRMSQMDLISAWKKNWSDHVVCHWIIEALLANDALKIEVVVSPLDAGAGAQGDQYSFGSGARRTFDLIEYYMTHDVETDAPLGDPDGARAAALDRLHIAPFFFTDRVPADRMIEGETYQWPNLSPEGYTATLKQPSLAASPPRNGVIGSAAMAVLNASGSIFKKVPSAPGNHAKIMIVDDELYIVGSDNLYPGFLSEFNYVIEGAEAVNELLLSYWEPLWGYSSPHRVK